MQSVDAHLQRVLGTVAPLREIELPILDAHGCLLSEDVVAAGPVPPFDNSSMDGYAVRAADLATATEQAPVRLHVVADIPAGVAPNVSVQPGMCARIMTGAVVPAGADAVVPVEWTDAGLAHVTISKGPQPGAFIRRAGEDVRAGQVVLP
jgi:molybdopterin molybdotransferase